MINQLIGNIAIRGLPKLLYELPDFHAENLEASLLSMNVGLVLVIIRLRFGVVDLPSRVHMPLHLTHFQVILSSLGFDDLG